MELGPDRDGKACGLGCWTFGAFAVAVVDVVVDCAADVLAAGSGWGGRSSILAVVVGRRGRRRHRAALPALRTGGSGRWWQRDVKHTSSFGLCASARSVCHAAFLT